MTLTDRVAHGATILDFVEPAWFDGVDINDLDMANTTTDVAALLGKPVAMNYTPDVLINRIGVGLMVEGEESFEELTDAWISEIKTRRGV